MNSNHHLKQTLIGLILGLEIAMACVVVQRLLPTPAHASQVVADHAARVVANDWVRTNSGWEHESSWQIVPKSYEPKLHPVLVAAMVCLTSLWGLIAFPAERARNVDEFRRNSA